ncbi:MAG: glycosyltransferase family 4 protein [Desulfobacterales bacterium]|jgi:glycosyltransferase involved in cell wall biosynthesis|nr:glycosyltransferase family 4 protein [Desulfobacterales bacterium]
MSIRVLYDISVLGIGSFHATGRTGIYRVVEHVAEGLARSPEIELSFCATQGLTQRAPDTIRACRHYLDHHPGFQHVPFFPAHFPSVDIFHSPFHPLPREIQTSTRILTIYDLIPLLFPEHMPAANTQMQRLSFSLLKPSDQLISISFATNQDLCRLIGIGPERTHVTHLAADPRLFHPCPDADRIRTVRAKYGLGPAPYILSLCTLEPRKNIDHVVRAFARLVRENPAEDWRLVLVGTRGWDFDRIFYEITSDPLVASRIITTGYVPDGELAPLYSGASVFAYMSVYEGFGLPPLEAMQCGTPVITSNTSSLPEVIGDAGIMLDPKDLDGLCLALNEVIVNTDMRSEMSQRSLARASQFSWAKCVQQTIAAYQSALAIRPAASIVDRKPAVVVDGVIFQLQHGRPFGISRHWVSLLSELAGSPLAERIVLLDRGQTAPEIPGIRRRRIPAFHLGTACQEADMLDAICREAGAGLFLSTYYTFTKECASLLMLYDMIPECFDTVGPDAPNPEWRDKFHAIVNSSSFAAISNSTARDLAKFYPRASQRPQSIVPCAVSSEFCLHTADEIAAFRKASRIDRPYFLLVGRPDAHKNLRMFFHAFSGMPDRQHYAIVMAGGRRTVEPEVGAMVEGADLYAGFFSDRDLSLAYSGAAALVFPSRCEGFGLPILEAMQSGCPVITCPNSAIPEVAGQAALYVDADDVESLQKALYDVQRPEVRATLVQHGLNQAQRFSWKRSASQLAEAIMTRFSS